MKYVCGLKLGYLLKSSVAFNTVKLAISKCSQHTSDSIKSHHGRDFGFLPQYQNTHVFVHIGPGNTRVVADYFVVIHSSVFSLFGNRKTFFWQERSRQIAVTVLGISNIETDFFKKSNLTTSLKKASLAGY